MLRTDHGPGRAAQLLLAAALTLASMVPWLALADDISNNLDTSVDALAEVMTLTAGGSNGTTQLYVVPQNGDGKNGCNLTGSTTLVVSVQSSDSSKATVSPTSITFESCGDTPTLTVTPVAAGSTTISLSQVSNTTGGTFNLAPATFTVNVNPAVTGTPPGAPSTPDLVASSDSGESDTDNITNDSTPTFTGTAEAGSLVKIYAGGVEKGSGTASGGTYTITTSALSDGVYNITATATNAYGTSSPSGSLSVTIDTTVSAPTLALDPASDTGASTSDGITHDNTPTFTGTAEKGSTVGLFRGGSTSLGTAPADASTGAWSKTVSTLADGTYSITAVATDVAGNVSTLSSALSLQIDTVAPAKPTVDLATSSDTGHSNSDNITKDDTPTFEGTAEVGSTVEIFDGSTGVGTGTATGGTYSITTSDLNDGVHSITAKATDLAGNTSDPSDAISVTIDTVSPAVDVMGVSDGAIYTLGSVPTAGCQTTDPPPSSGIRTNATLNVSGGTANGVGSFTATCSGAEDNAGNSAPPKSVSYLVWYGGLSGILQPINSDNTSLFNRGRAVPVKFQLAGDPSGGFNTSGWKLQSISVNCTTFDDADANPEDVPSNTPSTVFRYDSASDQYIYNADFKDKPVGSCWRVKVTLDSGQELTSASFKLTGK